jgi:RimJ/RimL family protein N-acetyltransferase
VPAIDLPERIEGRCCVLRPFVDADLAAWAQAFRDDPELGPAVGFETDPTVETLAGRPAKNRDRAEAGEYVDLAIVDPVDETTLLGGVILHSFEWRHMHTEVGFWLVAGARGAGAATEATALCVDWAFRELGMHRVEMTTLTTSDRVLALADRLGFCREGVMRERNLERGRRLDIVMLAILQEDWAFPLNQ